MRTIRFLLQKEFLQIFRNRAMLPILFAMPVIQLVVLAYAATYELREVNFALVDNDRSQYSRELVQKLESSGFFNLQGQFTNTLEAQNGLDRGEVKLVVQIPQNFEENLSSGQQVDIQLIIDAVDGTTGGLISSYTSAIISDFNTEKTAIMATAGPYPTVKLINLEPLNWYNPNLDYITFMVPGILVMLVSMIGLFLSGMNIVRERELGTIEQLNVTPISKSQFMIGKLVPFWIIGMIDLAIGLILARYAFQIPFLGSVLTIMVIAGIYLVLVQSIGLLISTVSGTQQQAMFIAWFIMVIFLLMGGLFTAIESMPYWAQQLTLANPVAYFINIMRLVLLKGAGWAEVYKDVLILLGMIIILLGVSINRYKKTAG
jgi:ABC-2 type transport system permease protein